MDDARVFLVSGGGDAVDSAYKIARRYTPSEAGKAAGTHIVSRTSSYHGTHGFGTSIAGIPANRPELGPAARRQPVVPHDSVEAFAELVGGPRRRAHRRDLRRARDRRGRRPPAARGLPAGHL
jgi:adenosylmethionine-8-amino-7-oxononanoate aminotransferase